MLDNLSILLNKLVQISYDLNSSVHLLDQLFWTLETQGDQDIINVILAALKYTNQNLQEIPESLDRLLLNEHKTRKQNAAVEGESN